MIVLRTSSSGGIKTFTAAKAYYPSQSHGTTVNTTMKPNCDSSSFSAVTDPGSRFQMDRVSRLSQEIRTSTTTGRIQELRQSVASGEYQPDPAEIAKRLLFFLEV